MRCLKRNKQTVYYKNLINAEQSADAQGIYNGGINISYGEYQEIQLNVGRPLFEVIIKGYGIDYNYDRVLVTNDINLAVNEATIFKIEDTEYRVVSISKTINTLQIRLKQSQ